MGRPKKEPANEVEATKEATNGVVNTPEIVTPNNEETTIEDVTTNNVETPIEDAQKEEENTNEEKTTDEAATLTEPANEVEATKEATATDNTKVKVYHLVGSKRGQTIYIPKGMAEVLRKENKIIIIN